MYRTKIHIWSVKQTVLFAYANCLGVLHGKRGIAYREADIAAGEDCEKQLLNAEMQPRLDLLLDLVDVTLMGIDIAAPINEAVFLLNEVAPDELESVRKEFPTLGEVACRIN